MEKQLRIIFATILAAAACFSSAAYTESYYAPESGLASGHWVKLRVSQTGMYEVSYEQLRQWGFSNPGNVAVYGYGGSRLIDNVFSSSLEDDLPQTATFHTADGRLLFYGESEVTVNLLSPTSIEVKRNHYDTGSYYYLSDCNEIRGIPASAYYGETANPFDIHYSVQVIENEVQNPNNAGIYFHGTPLKPGESESFKFHVKNFNPQKISTTVSNGFFQYDFVVRNTVGTRLNVEYPTDKINLPVNPVNNTCSSLLHPSKIYNSSSGQARFTQHNESGLQDDTLTIKIELPASSGASYCAIDRAMMAYPRANRLDDEPFLIVNVPYVALNHQQFRFSDASESLQVWNIVNPRDIFSYDLNHNKEDGSASGNFDRLYNQRNGTGKFIAFDASREQLHPEFVEILDNQNLHGHEVPDMLIITTRTLMPQARELAEIHRNYNGLDVSVVCQDLIFNEFSSGSRIPMAYRRFAKMFHDREPDKFKYILLYGAGTWDNRFITESEKDVLLTFQAEINDHARDYSRCYTSDVYFGMLSDNYTPNQIHFMPGDVAVGRIPATDMEKAILANNKIRKYLDNPPTPAEFLHAMMMSDDGDNFAHYKQAEDVSDTMLCINPGITITKIHDSYFPIENYQANEARKMTLRSLQRGQGYWNYSGHATEDQLSTDQLWSINLNNKTTFRSQSLAMLSTCVTFPFDRMSNAIAEMMLYQQDGGAAAIVGACRSVFLDYNGVFSVAMGESYATAQPGMTVGDVFRIARNNQITNNSSDNSSGDRAVNTLCYNLCGDPALPLSVPKHKIVIDLIDDNVYSDDEMNLLNPLSKTNIKAHITDNRGNLITDFNGTGLLEIYDSPRSLSVDTFATTFDEYILLEKPIAITDGTADIDFVLPQADLSGTSHRIVITATDNLSHDHAAGFADNIMIAESVAGDIDGLDTAAPEISSFYIESPEFSDGDIVGKDFTVYATVIPPSTGLNMAYNQIGSSTKLNLDKNSSYPEIATSAKYNDDGTISLSYALSDITDGNHSLTLSVANNVGVRAYATIDFTVISSPATATLSTDTEGKAARSDIAIDLEHSFSDTPEATLIICDANGNTVYSRRNCTFPHQWNLTDNMGQNLPDGSYNAKAILREGNNYGSTPELGIVIVR